jgi:hypothetical protein
VKRFLMIFMIALSPWPCFASDGTKDNGGDLLVQEFISKAYQLANFFEKNPLGLTINFSAAEFKNQIERLNASINEDPEQVQPDLIQFVTKTLYDSSGLEKPLIYNETRRDIKINNNRWLNFSDEEKYQHICAEVFGLMNLTLDRYRLAFELVQNHSATIMGYNFTDPKNCYQALRRNAYGKSMCQFSQIQADDLIINGKLLGSGTETNTNFIDFLKDSSSNKLWVKQIFDRLQLGRGAFFIANGPDGRLATVTHLQIQTDTQTSGRKLVATSLLFSRIAIGSYLCWADQEGYPFHQITHCLLDSNAYDSTADSIEIDLTGNDLVAASTAIRELNRSLYALYVQHYALSDFSVTNAILLNSLRDFSQTAEDYRLTARVNALYANDLEPDLVGPFEARGPWYWKTAMDKKSQKIVGAKKIQSALEIILHRKSIYLNSNWECTDSENEPSQMIGPMIVKKDTFAKWQSQNACLRYRMGSDFAHGLFLAMEKIGFNYDQSSETWSNAQK